jgi:hypothetical protein
MNPRLWRIAIHEAAHATIARVLRIPIRGVTITPSEGFLGHCHIYRDFYKRSGYVIALMAGVEAELEFFEATVNDSADRESIAEANDDWPKIGGRKARALNLPSLRRQARRLVRKHRTKIERVAAALLERGTLGPDEVDELITPRRS